MLLPSPTSHGPTLTQFLLEFTHHLSLENEYEKDQNSLEYVEDVREIQIAVWIACERCQYFNNPRYAHHNEQFDIHDESVRRTRNFRFRNAVKVFRPHGTHSHGFVHQEILASRLYIILRSRLHTMNFRLHPTAVNRREYEQNGIEENVYAGRQ